MKKICLALLSLCSVVSAANMAQAACSPVTCAELGYSQSDVLGCKSYIYCPLDTSYKACYSYRTYTNGACPTGANCDMRYKITKCPSGYVLNMAKTECVKSTVTCDSSYNLASCPSHGTCASCGGKFALASCDGCSTKNGSKCDYQSVMNKASMCQAIGYGSQTYDFCKSNFTGDGFTFCISVLQEFRRIKTDSGEENVSVVCDIMCPTIDSCSTTPCP